MTIPTTNAYRYPQATCPEPAIGYSVEGLEKQFSKLIKEVIKSEGIYKKVNHDLYKLIDQLEHLTGGRVTFTPTIVPPLVIDRRDTIEKTEALLIKQKNFLENVIKNTLGFQHEMKEQIKKHYTARHVHRQPNHHERHYTRRH